MIYFDENKQAYSFEIENCICAIEEEVWAQYASTDKWNIVNGEFIDISETDEYKKKKEEEEEKRLAMLNMTGADVERAIYKVKGIDFDDILAMVKDNPAIDEKALKIEFKANDFYRGNPYIEQVGNLLGFTTEMLDRFFETKDYHELLPKEGLEVGETTGEGGQ